MTDRGPVSALQYFVSMVPLWAPWMSFNLALACVPVVLACLLFRSTCLASSRRHPLWWLGVLCFLAFLPNAPYILTNARWLVGPWRNAWHHDPWRFVLIVPWWGFYFLLGLAAFVYSMRRLELAIARSSSARVARWSVVGMTGMCALGLYLGRLDLNSWSLITDPDQVVVGLRLIAQGHGAEGIAVSFAGMAALYISVMEMLPVLVGASSRRRSRLVSVVAAHLGVTGGRRAAHEVLPQAPRG